MSCDGWARSPQDSAKLGAITLPDACAPIATPACQNLAAALERHGAPSCSHPYVVRLSRLTAPVALQKIRLYYNVSALGSNERAASPSWAQPLSSRRPPIPPSSNPRHSALSRVLGTPVARYIPSSLPLHSPPPLPRPSPPRCGRVHARPHSHNPASLSPNSVSSAPSAAPSPQMQT